MMNPMESDIFPFVTLMNDYKRKRQLHLVTESVWQRAIFKCKVRCVSRIICQPCDLRMTVVSTIPDNALLRKLRVLHSTKFWIFSPIDKNSVLSR